MKKALNHLKKSDPVLAAIIASVGPYKPSYHEPTFRALVRSIVFQQLAGAAARTIFNRLEAACLPRNTASIRLLEKVGFSREGYARKYLCIDGRWQDHVLYGLVRDDPRG